jgi:hypothetical protein
MNPDFFQYDVIRNQWSANASLRLSGIPSCHHFLTPPDEKSEINCLNC